LLLFGFLPNGTFLAAPNLDTQEIVGPIAL
jgi:hypothetical protein